MMLRCRQLFPSRWDFSRTSRPQVLSIILGFFVQGQCGQHVRQAIANSGANYPAARHLMTDSAKA
jgi:hypothetical protein